MLTHWGWVTHICVSKLPTIGADNGLSPGQRQAIIQTNAGKLLIGPLWTNFSEILIEIPIFSFKKMRLKEPSAKWRPCCLGLNVLMCIWHVGIVRYGLRQWETTLFSVIFYWLGQYPEWWPAWKETSFCYMIQKIRCLWMLMVRCFSNSHTAYQ